jgi:cobalamin biosynthesis protein CobT
MNADMAKIYNEMANLVEEGKIGPAISSRIMQARHRSSNKHHAPDNINPEESKHDENSPSPSAQSMKSSFNLKSINESTENSSEFSQSDQHSESDSISEDGDHSMEESINDNHHNNPLDSPMALHRRRFFSGIGTYSDFAGLQSLLHPAQSSKEDDS